jgi:Uma2 family endonuclease
VEERELGRVFGSRVAFRLGEKQGPEPDIAFVATENLHRVKRGHVDGPPDLALEIVSPDSVERDYVHKREQYRQAGVPEYWIVDELQESVLLLRRSAAGAYREVKPRKGVLQSQALPGFWLRPEWLWQQPRPKKDSHPGGNSRRVTTGRRLSGSQRRQPYRPRIIDFPVNFPPPAA